MTNADIIARALAMRGVEYAYGLPGGEVVALIDAFRRVGIRFFLVGHEASAAFMADVTGQITGRPGICVATLGPGAMNLATGVASAYLERSPMLALTAQISPDLYPSFTHQRIALDKVFAAITKRSLLLDGADTEDVVLNGFDLACCNRPGPVHMMLPSDVAVFESRSSIYSADRSDATMLRRTSHNPMPRSREVDDVVEHIRAAHRPLLVVGLGARPGDSGAIRYLLDVTQWPWVTTPRGKGIVPEDHLRFLGVVGGMAIDDVLLETLDASDLLIGIGFDPVECDKPWFLHRPIVSINGWTTVEAAYRPQEVVGEISTIISSLATRLPSQPWPEAILQDRRSAIQRTSSGPTAGLSPLTVLEALRVALPDDTVLTCDVGSHKLLAGQFWRTIRPHTFFVSNGLSSMGYGLPAAIAAALHFRTQPVAALVGDGGMLMMASDLVLLAALDLPVLVVVFTDRSLSLIRAAQVRRGLPIYGTDFAPPDFVKWAAACGIGGARASTLDEVRMYADAAVKQRAPFLIDVAVTIEGYEGLL